MKTTAGLIIFFILSFILQKASAQGYWDQVQEAEFRSDVTILLQNCDNNFADIRGKLIDSTGENKVYECTRQLANFSIFILKMPDGSWKISGVMTVDPDGDDMDEVKYLLAGLPDFTLIDSRTNATISIPNTAERCMIAANSDKSRGIQAVLYLENNSNINILIGKGIY